MNRSDVQNVLLEMGIPAGIKGFRYITDAIITLDDVEFCTKRLVTLYTRVAEINHTTASRAECAIRHAFVVARTSKGNYEAVDYYIGFTHASNLNSLKMLHTRIKQCEEKKSNIGDENKDTDRDAEEDKIRRIVREELKTIMGGIA